MKNFSLQPLIILILVAALVILSALYVLKVPVVNKVHNSFSANAEQATLDNSPSFHWKMTTSWPKGFPGLGTAPEVFAKHVSVMSRGRLTITVYGAREIVPPLGVFDAVSNGSVEVGHTGAYYWKGKSPAAPFFTTVPFGDCARNECLVILWWRHRAMA